MRRLVLWEGIDDWRSEVAHVDLLAAGLVAQGTQIGLDPVPYRLDYRLDASDRFVTRSLDVEVTGAAWSRRVELRHDGTGGWTCVATADGDVALPAPGGDVDAVSAPSTATSGGVRSRTPCRSVGTRSTMAASATS